MTYESEVTGVMLTLIDRMKAKLPTLDEARTLKAEMWLKLDSAESTIRGEVREVEEDRAFSEVATRVLTAREELTELFNIKQKERLKGTQPMPFGIMASTGASCEEGYHWDYEANDGEGGCVADE